MTLRRRVAAAWRAFFDRPWTVDQVRRKAHELGMHHNADYACDLCFVEMLANYMAICDQILIEIDRADALIDFRRHMQQMVESSVDRALLLHEHPAYVIADFLEIDPASTTFATVIETAARIMAV